MITTSCGIEYDDEVRHVFMTVKLDIIIVKVSRGGYPCNGTYCVVLYTKTFYHKAANGKDIKCKSGTQVMDRLWQHIRSQFKNRSHNVGSQGLCT